MTDAELIARALIDYTDPDIIARQNIAPNAGCNIDGKFYDVRNLVHLASSQADRIEALIEESGRRLALARSEGVARVEQFERTEALTEQLAAARQDAKEAEAYAEELEKERDDYAHKLMQANNTYTEMHLEIERLSDKLATCEKYRDAYAEMGRIGTQAVRDLEAKLAKAVEALSDLMMHEPDHPDTIWEKARTTLAEIKGESHE